MAYSCIVLGNDHYNTLNVIRSLGSAGIQVFAIIQADEAKSFVLKSKYTECGEVIQELDTDYIIGKYAKADVLIPILATCDSCAAFLDLNYEKLSQHFILPSVGKTPGRLIEEMDKKIQLRHAANVGFDIPESIALNVNDISSSDMGVIPYPCIIKPEESIGGSKHDFRIAYNRQELSVHLDNLKGHLNRVLIQEFIPNDHIILIAGVRTYSGDNYVFGEIEKIKHSSQLHNLGLNCIGVLNPISELRKACINYVEAINYYGCYSIEAIRVKTESKQNHNYFIEINLRTDGLLYFYQKGGVNFPSIWVESCFGKKIDVTPTHRKIYGMTEFNYLKHQLSLSAIPDLIKTDVFSIFKLNDIKPFIYKFVYYNHN